MDKKDLFNNEKDNSDWLEMKERRMIKDNSDRLEMKERRMLIRKNNNGETLGGRSR